MKAQPESVTNETYSEHSNADVVDNTSIVLKEELRLKGAQLAGAIIGIRSFFLWLLTFFHWFRLLVLRDLAGESVLPSSLLPPLLLLLLGASAM